MANERLGVFQRHPLPGIVLLDVERDQVVRTRLGEIEEVVGLLDRVARPPEMVGAPFQAERLGDGLARVEELACNGMAFPQRLAEPDLGLVARTSIGWRKSVRRLVDEADNALVARQPLPVDGIVLVGVDDQRAVFSLPRFGEVGGIGGGCTEKDGAKNGQGSADKTIDRLKQYPAFPCC